MQNIATFFLFFIYNAYIIKYNGVCIIFCCFQGTSNTTQFLCGLSCTSDQIKTRRKKSLEHMNFLKDSSILLNAGLVWFAGCSNGKQLSDSCLVCWDWNRSRHRKGRTTQLARWRNGDDLFLQCIKFFCLCKKLLLQSVEALGFNYIKETEESWEMEHNYTKAVAHRMGSSNWVAQA